MDIASLNPSYETTKSAIAVLHMRRNGDCFTYRRPLPATNSALPEGVLEHALRGYAAVIGESIFARIGHAHRRLRCRLMKS